MSENKICKFRGKIIRQVYNSENFKVYGVECDFSKYPEIKSSRYGTVSIIGDLPELNMYAEYDIEAVETESKNGIGYKVRNIHRDVPIQEDDVKIFLNEILTARQADTLFENYPDIIQRVRENKLDDIDLKRLKGIGEYTFEIIKRKIIENFCLADLVVEFQGFLSLTIIKKIYDRYSSVEVLKKHLRQDPYKCLCGFARIGFKTADDILLKMEMASKENVKNGKESIIDFEHDLKTSPERCLACTMFVLQENENKGNTRMNLVELRRKVLQIVPECIDHFPTALQSDKIYYSKEKLVASLKRTYDTERYIANNIIESLNSEQMVWDCDVEKYRVVDGIELSDEQMKLLDSVCKNQITVLTAPAGSGKSQSTKSLIKMLKDNRKSFILCTPTGKSAKKLSEYTGEIANTIHRTLGYTPNGFTYCEENKLNTDLILIDEVGMTDVFLFKRVLEAVNTYTKIVLIGDIYQLNSCGAGCILRDIVESNKVPHIVFTKVFRLGKGGALTACTYVRQNKKFINKNEIISLGEDKTYTFIPCTKTDINEKIIKLYKKLLETNNYKDITVISSYNIGENGCENLNRLLQPIANKNTINSNKFLSIQLTGKAVKYFIGDSVISNVNNYHARLSNEDGETFIANGTQGIITDIDTEKKSMIICFDDSVSVVYNQGQFNTLKHSFAISCHKMQGSQNKIIIFCCPSSHMFFLNNNLIYTSLSRAEKVIYHFSDAKTINYAMNKSDNKRRDTFLCELLSTKSIDFLEE